MSDTMTIHFDLNGRGEPLELSCSHNTRVADVKSYLQRFTGWRATDMFLIYAGKKMQDDKSLGYYGLQDNHRVSVTQRVQGGSALLALVGDKKRMEQHAPPGISGAPVYPWDMFTWRCTLIGLKDCPYANGIYTVELKFPNNYPLKPPRARFLCPMFHPNVGSDGGICVNILKEEGWNQKYDVRDVMKCIMALLLEPNPESPLNGEAARLLKENYREFCRKCNAIAVQSCNYLQ